MNRLDGDRVAEDCVRFGEGAPAKIRWQIATGQRLGMPFEQDERKSLGSQAVAQQRRWHSSLFYSRRAVEKVSQVRGVNCLARISSQRGADAVLGLVPPEITSQFD